MSLPTIFTGISAGLGAINAAKSLFGGGTNDQYKQDQANANNEASTLGDIGNWYRQQAADQNNYYNTDNAAARTAATNLENFYNTNPNNDAEYARELAMADNGLHSNIAKMTFQNAANSAANGQVTPSGTPSSLSTGINAYLQALDALGTSQNQIQVAGENYDRRQSNMQNDYNLTNGMATQDYGNANQATGNESNITTQLMDYWNGQAQNELQQEQQAGASTMGGLADFATTLGSMFPGNSKKPAVQTAQPAQTPLTVTNGAVPVDAGVNGIVQYLGGPGAPTTTNSSWQTLLKQIQGVAPPPVNPALTY